VSFSFFTKKTNRSVLKALQIELNYEYD